MLLFSLVRVSWTHDLILLSRDGELNPGPSDFRHGNCRVLYTNVLGLHANLRDLAVASDGFDMVLCSETLVSDQRHLSEILMPGFCKPVLIRRRELAGSQDMAVYVMKRCSASRQPRFECACHEAMISGK